MNDDRTISEKLGLNPLEGFFLCIQRLVEYAKKVMTGKIIIEDSKNPLFMYSYNKEIYPATAKIEMFLRVLDLSLNNDGNNACMIVQYTIIYSNLSGDTVMRSSADLPFPSKWTIEKQGDEWVVVDIDERA
jgi:hypothetical protein